MGRGSLWPAGTGKVVVNIYSRTWVLESWRSNSAFTERLTPPGLAPWWALGSGLAAASETQPWVSLRAAQAAGKEGGLESGVQVLAQTAGAPGSGEGKETCVWCQPGCLGVAPSPCPAQIGEGSGTLQKAGRPPAGSSQGRLHGRGGP